MNAEETPETVPPWLWLKAIARSGKTYDVKLFRTLVALTTYADAASGDEARPGIERLIADTGFSKSTIIRHLQTAVELGLVHLHAKGRRRGGRGFASEYWLTLPAEFADSQGVTGDDTLADSQGVKSDSQGVKPDVPRCHPGDTPPHQAHQSIHTGSSSARRADDDVRRDEGVIRGEDAREGALAQAGGSTVSGKDQKGADSRPASQDTGPGSRAKRDSKGRGARSAPRAQRGTDEFQELAQKLAKIDAWFKPKFLVPRFRAVANNLGISAQVMAEAIDWWRMGHAPGIHHPNEVDGNGHKVVPNPGGYLNRVLPNLCQAFLVARERQAKDLRFDPASFDLVTWLLDQGETQDRAEGEEDQRAGEQREAVAQGQEAMQACQEIRALMETILPHAAAVFYHGRADGEQCVREQFLSPTITYTGKREAIRDDDIAAWKRKAKRLANDFGDELPYAEEACPGDSDLVLARKFYDELVADHAWLTA